MTEIFALAGKIAGIGGLVVVVFLLLFLAFIRKNIFSRLNQERSYRILLYFLVLTFCVAVIGMGIWHFSSSNKDRNGSSGRFPSPDNLRVIYLRIGGHAIDLFTKNELNESLDKVLGSHTYTNPNVVFTELTRLINQFSAPLNATSITLLRDKVEEAREIPGALEKYLGKPFFIGSNFYRPPEIYISRSDVGRVLTELTSNHFWRVNDEGLENEQFAETFIENLKSGSMDANSFGLFRLADRAEIEKFRSAVPQNDMTAQRQFEFYKFITREGVPEHFSIITFNYSSCGSGSGALLLNLHRLPMFLEVAIFENVSASVIEVGEFLLRTHRTIRLRSRSDDDRILKQMKTETAQYFPPKLLKPGEKLIIPLRLLFKREGLYSESPKKRYNRQKVIETLQTMDKGTMIDINDPYSPPEQKSVAQLPVTELIAAFERIGGGVGGQEQFVYGPSIRLEQISTGGTIYQIRELEPHHFVLRSGMEVGSCPYIFTYSDKSHSWLNEGHILYGRNSAAKKGFDEVKLTRFNGSILIREKDPETSFIDQIYIRAVTVENKEFTYLPKNQLLRRRDSNYVILNRGDELKIDFDVPRKLPRGNYFIVANGYYVPYQNESNGPTN